MTSEMAEESFQAVRCLYCSEPIRLSTRLLELFVVKTDNATAEINCKSRVFILRCEACAKETRFLKSEIETFEGPAKQATRPRTNPGSYPKSFLKAVGL